MVAGNPSTIPLRFVTLKVCHLFASIEQHRRYLEDKVMAEGTHFQLYVCDLVVIHLCT